MAAACTLQQLEYEAELRRYCMEMPPTSKLGRLAKVDEFIGLLQEMKKESKELFAELFPDSFRRWFVYRESKNLLFNLISNHVLYAKAFVYQKQPSYDMQIVLYTM
ncbi:hypothetical protein [Methanothrix sp.]|jgi:hypothetical protein|uniref:hypothetical protein n=1 Tax=Methanothrix sp. TaxID=90426 RepID=UPI001BD53AE0